MHSRLALAEVVVAHDDRAAGADVDRVVVVEQQRRRQTSGPTHEAALLQRLLLRQRFRIWRSIAVDEDVRCRDVGLGANDVRQMQNCQVGVHQLTNVRRVGLSCVERHQPQTNIQISEIHDNRKHLYQP